MSTNKQKGRPAISEHKRLEMRSKIALKAKELFQEEGYSQVSIRKIASGIGCSPMTLYKYYDAKIDILRTLWADIFNDVFKRVDAHNLDDYSVEEYLSIIACTYVMFWQEKPEYYRLVFMADGVTQGDVSLFVDNPELAARYSVFSDAISRVDPILEEDCLALKFNTLICGLHGIAHNLVTISGYPWGEPKQIIEMMLNGVISRQ